MDTENGMLRKQFGTKQKSSKVVINQKKRERGTNGRKPFIGVK